MTLKQTGDVLVEICYLLIIVCIAKSVLNYALLLHIKAIQGT